MKRKRRRGKLLVIHGHRCAYCGRNLTISTMTVDHRQARAFAGSGAKTNLVPACERCNVKKAARTEASFRAWLQTPAGLAWLELS